MVHCVLLFGYFGAVREQQLPTITEIILNHTMIPWEKLLDVGNRFVLQQICEACSAYGVTIE